MTRIERFLMYLACVCLLIAGLTLTAGAQTMPGMLNPDPAYWYGQYVAEKNRADGLAKSGDVAIRGLQATITSANQTITDQNERLAKLTQRVNVESGRADQATAALAPVTAERDRLKGKTWVGQQVRKARNVLAVFGGVVVVAGATKLVTVFF